MTSTTLERSNTGLYPLYFASITALTCQILLLEIVAMPSAGLAASLSGFAYVATLELSRRYIFAAPIHQRNPDNLVILLCAGAIIYIHVTLNGLMSDVAGLTYLIPSLLSVTGSGLLAYWSYKYATAVGPRTREDTEPFQLTPARIAGLAAIVVFGMVSRALTLDGYLANPALWAAEGLWTNSYLGEAQRTALTFAETGNYAHPYRVGETGPTAHVAPLHTSLLAIIYTFFGSRTVASAYVQGILALVAATTTIALLPWLAVRARLSERTGWLAAAALTLKPLFIDQELLGEWEQPYSALFLVLGLAAFIRLQQDWRDPLSLIAAGAITGLSALLSPTLILASGLALIVTLAVERHARWEILRASVVIGAIVLAVISPWIIRNAVALGHFVPIRSNFGLELSLGNAPLEMYNYIADLNSYVHPNTNQDELKKLRAVGEVSYMNHRRDQALAWIADHPSEFARRTAIRFQKFFFPDARHLLRNPGLATEIRGLLLSLISLTTFLGLAYLLYMRHRFSIFLLAFTLAPALPYLITHVHMRYRTPLHVLMTLICIELAVIIVLALRHWLAARPRKLSG